MEKKKKSNEETVNAKETVNTELVNTEETVNTKEIVNIKETVSIQETVNTVENVNIKETENNKEIVNTEETDLNITFTAEENELYGPIFLLLPRLIFIFTVLIKFLIKTLRVYIKQTVGNFKGKLSAHDLLEKQYFVDNKAKGRISKRVFQESKFSKHAKISEDQTLLTP